jgi:hypothetical protein
MPFPRPRGPRSRSVRRGTSSRGAMPPLTWQSQPSTSGVTGHGRCGGGMSSRGDAAAPSASRPRSRSVRRGTPPRVARPPLTWQSQPSTSGVPGHDRCGGSTSSRGDAAAPPRPLGPGHDRCGAGTSSRRGDAAAPSASRPDHDRCGGSTSSRGDAAAPSASRPRSRSCGGGTSSRGDAAAPSASRARSRSVRRGTSSRRAMPPLARQGQPSTSGPTSAWGTGALTGSPATRPRVTR